MPSQKIHLEGMTRELNLQPGEVSVSSKHEKSSDLADSGKKELSGVERFAPVFSGLRISGTKGITFLPVSMTFFTKRLPLNGEQRNKENVLRDAPDRLV